MAKAKTKLPLSQIAIQVVSDAWANREEGVSPRQHCLHVFTTQYGMGELMAKTYYRNALVALMNQDAEAVAVAREKGKPVHSVVKVNKDNVVTSVGYFTKATAAKQFNQTFEFHGVVKGAVEVGETVELGRKSA